MSDAREVIALALHKHRRLEGELDGPVLALCIGEADAILSALRAHFAQPGAVTDEMALAAMEAEFGKGLTKEDAKSRGGEHRRSYLAAALQKME